MGSSSRGRPSALTNLPVICTGSSIHVVASTAAELQTAGEPREPGFGASARNTHGAAAPMRALSRMRVRKVRAQPCDVARGENIVPGGSMRAREYSRTRSPVFELARGVLGRPMPRGSTC